MKNTLKCVIAIVVNCLIVFSLVACSQQTKNKDKSLGADTDDLSELELIEYYKDHLATSVNTDPEFEDSQPVGTWMLPESVELASGEDDVFYKAFDGSEGYSPIALVGKQLVVGMNYRYLCVHEEAGSTYYSIVELYKDLEGNVSVTNKKDFESPKNPEDWQTVEFLSMDPEYQPVFDGANIADYEPIAVVCRSLSGDNGYAFLCMRGPLATSYGISYSHSTSEGSSVSVSEGVSNSETAGIGESSGSSFSTSTSDEFAEYILVYVQETGDGSYSVETCHLK